MPAKRSRTGSPATLPQSPEPRVPDHLFRISEQEVFRSEGARAPGAVRTIDLAKFAPSDVIEVTLDSGARLYTTLGQFLNDYPPQRPRGEARPTQFELPAALTAPDSRRGIAGMVIKALKKLNIDPVGGAAKLSARELCEWYEKRQLEPARSGVGQEALWRCRTEPGKPFALLPVTSAEIKAGKPLLVLLHGTASSTRGSFSELWNEPSVESVRTELFSEYQDRIFAFEHYSLTRSPIENALNLLEWLPANAEVHLLSHSRGGLIGELLCRGQRTGGAPFEATDIDLAYGRGTAAEQPHRALLETLSAALAKKKITVERFIRVACPARGTRLASERLDRALTITLNIIGAVVPPGMSDFFDVFREFALALIETRADPAELPGLQAMVPESAFVKLINLPTAASSADLHVIAGDIEGGPLWKRLGVWVTDRFFDTEHDLVVHTPAMYGGAARPGDSARYFFAQGEDVNHFSYFKRLETARKIADGLLRAPESDGFEAFDPATKIRAARAPIRIAAPTGERPIVVLLPGIMGSELAHDGDCIWLSARLLLGALERLAIDRDGVKPVNPLEDAYSDLIVFLGATHDVVPFAFDWRLSLRSEAVRLRDRLTELIEIAEPNGRPVSLLAHSMGGLLARVLIADHPAIWQRMTRHRDARLIMLGTPNKGSHSICRLLTNRESLVQGLALADLKHSAREVVDIVKRFPGVLEMLPNYQDDLDFFSHTTWQQLAQEDDGRWSPPSAEDVERARETRELLDRQQLPADRIVYVAGCAEETPGRLKRGVPPPPPHTGESWQPPFPDGQIYFEASARGDGRVLWESGIPEGIHAWYSDAAHGDLASNEEDFPALVELLASGTTSLLPRQPPRLRAAAEARPAIMRTRKIERYPDDGLLVAAALGRIPERRRRERMDRFDVYVAHGNLIYARFPVAVGHYQGDTIISSEASIDAQLNGRLTDRRQLDVYPGPIGTCQVFLNPPGKFPGAVVVGLGRVGDLTPGSLTDTFQRGVLEYALAMRERAGGKGESDIAIRLSSLLIGTGAGGLSVRDSLASLLRGVRDANRELARSKTGVRIEQLEILELWQDRAIEAARLMNDLMGDVELSRAVRIDPNVNVLRGGRRRVTFEEQRGWWHRLQIASGERGELRFTRLTDRARAEVTLLPTQRGLVENFIDQATADTVRTPQIARTLFELLLPNELKQRAPEAADLVLVLDDQAAQYPWELIEDGLTRDRSGDFVTGAAAGPGIKPLAVRVGIIRQRLTHVYRSEPRTSLGRSALVIGDPKLDWDLFADLPGARAEAKAVAQMLRDKEFAVVERIEAAADDVVEQLFAQPYRILHLAGHGVYGFVTHGGSELTGWLKPASPEGQLFQVIESRDTQQRPWFRVAYSPSSSGELPFRFEQGELASGMVIGRNMFLTPKLMRQMRAIPELVFINCCFGGKDTAPPRDRNQLAANLATQLIEMGVKAVIAAGWAVEDNAAQLFAETFYSELFSGQPFGRAVYRARVKVYDSYEQVNTWGAYQCYGDPDFYITDRRAESDADDKIQFVAEAEAIAAIDNIYQNALTARASNIEWLRDRLAKLDKVALAKWPNSGALHDALGRAYGELDIFDSAIEHYQAALKSERADVDLKALEQLANLKARKAEAEVRKQPPDPDAATIAIEEAERLLDALLNLGAYQGRDSTLSETAERYALMGGVHKRKAMIAAVQGRDVERPLKQMIASYRKSEELRLKARAPFTAYPAIQQILAEVLMSERPADPRDVKRLTEQILKAKTETSRLIEEERQFWTRANLAGCVLAQALLDDTLNEHVDEIVGAYREAQERGASLREWRSVVEGLDFIRILVSRWPRGARSDATAEALDRIYRGLEFFVPGGAASLPAIIAPGKARRRSAKGVKK